MVRRICALANLVFKPRIPWGSPIHIQLEPCNFCNLRCTFCSWYRADAERRCLRMDEFMIILDACRPQYITFSGYGEPLLNPELADMIREARRRGTVLNTTTNGVLLSEQASA